MERVGVTLAVVVLVAAVLAACDRAPAAPPSSRYTAADAAADAAAAQRMRQSRRIPRDGGDPTIAFAPELEPFLGVWYDEESGLDSITVAKASDGLAHVVMHGGEKMLMVVDRVRLEQGHLRFDIGSYWIASGPNPMAGGEGLPAQCDLSIDAQDPDLLVNRMSSEILDKEVGTQQFRRRPPESDGNAGDGRE